MANKKLERKEAWMRLLVGIVSGIILYVWFWLTALLFVINWFYVIIKGKKLKELSEMCETWNTQNYSFIRYMTFGSNKRPFPFNNLEKSMNKIA